MDWVLEMRRFPDEALFDRLAKQDKLDPPLLVRLTDIIAGFHERSEVSRRPTPERDLKAVIEGNAERFGQAVAALAARLQLPFHGLWLEATVATRIARVRGRSKDASDADEAVARQQLDVALGDDELWHVLPADDAPEAVAAQARAMIRSALS